MSSCCYGKSGCGSESSCGCGSCKMYPESSYTVQTTNETLIMGIASTKVHPERAEMGVEAENGCKCGANCTCNPCNCK